MQIPKDPVILMSYLNTQLRDYAVNLEEFCKSMQVDAVAIQEKLSEIGYRYDVEKNQFVHDV